MVYGLVPLERIFHGYFSLSMRNHPDEEEKMAEM